MARIMRLTQKVPGDTKLSMPIVMSGEIKAGRFGIGVNAPRRAEREGCGNF